MSNRGDFTIGMLVGGIAGFLAGILLAPRAGEDTRQQLRQNFDDVSEEAQARGRETLVNLREGVDQLSDILYELRSTLPQNDEIELRLSELEREVDLDEEQVEDVEVSEDAEVS